jgi:hypothetical protein|tara:strand:- start:362 stop:1225 length:864 start_codon:yes stop_codon:yes gene_type:complete
MEQHYLRAHVRDDHDDESVIRFVAATPGQKKDGIDLRMGGVSLDRFESNPVVLWAHDYERPPIGRVVRTDVGDDELVMDVEFDREDPFAAEVDRKYRDGFMSSVSIGFDFDEVGERGVVDDWEIMELSAVPIGLDPNALVAAGRSGARALRAELVEEVKRIDAEFPDDDWHRWTASVYRDGIPQPAFITTSNTSSYTNDARARDTDFDSYLKERLANEPALAAAFAALKVEPDAVREIPSDWPSLIARLQEDGFIRTGPSDSDEVTVSESSAAALLAAIGNTTGEQS